METKTKHDRRLLIVSNRLPVHFKGEGERLELHPSSGGLVSAIDSYLRSDSAQTDEVYWCGVPGCSPADWKEASKRLPASSYQYVPVLSYDQEYELYYNGFSNSVLWPLFHYFPCYAEYDEKFYASYIKVNERFRDAMLPHLRAGDTVWIHDYHLIPLAAMLREARPELSIGFFLHIPFPSYEIFRMMPPHWQESLLKGLLGADLIGFHTQEYSQHFLRATESVLHLENHRQTIHYENRLVKTGAFPIGIDFAHFHEAWSDHSISVKREDLRKRLEGKKILFSVDRLDYTKGVHNRLKAYEQFLEANPEFQGKVVFILVVVPSRDQIAKYAERKSMIDEQISRINSCIGNLHWQPVIYQYSSLSFEDMLSMYTACDLALITPLRDGMNLVAKEFAASRKDGSGVLILSELAGAAAELQDALLINPHDTGGIAHKIKEALLMPEVEQNKRMTAMQTRIRSYTVQHWASDFMTQLDEVKSEQLSFQHRSLDELSKRAIYAHYRNSESRLFFLEFEGALCTSGSASPSPAIKELLDALCQDPRNHVVLSSSQDKEWMDEYFSGMQLSLVAETGAFIKKYGEDWVKNPSLKTGWKNSAFPVLESQSRRFPGSTIVETDSSIIWKLNDSGDLPVADFKELSEKLSALPLDLECSQNKNTVKIWKKRFDSLGIVQQLLSALRPDFLLAGGGKYMDEKIFQFIRNSERAIGLRIGDEASYSHYQLHSPGMLISLLHYLRASCFGNLSTRLRKIS